jgi:large conductance mechanosensitive channel
MRKFINDFKEFALRGNVMDMAIGIVIGLAFGKIVTSLVSDIIMPPIGLLMGNLDFSNLFWNISGTSYDSLETAIAAGAPIIKYGMFINTIIDFVIVALVVFFIIRLMSNLKRREKKPVEVNTRECPYCISSIPARATRCPNCTSQFNT